MENEEHLLRRGFLFILGIYTTYLIYGVGFLSGFSQPAFGKFLVYFMSVIGLIVGIYSFKKFFSRKKLFKLPEKVVHLLEKVRKIFISPVGVFTFGLIAALFTLSQVSGVFLLIRLREGTSPLLFYYVLLFVLLLIIVVLLSYFLRIKSNVQAVKNEPYNERRANLWKDHYLKLFNFMIALLILVLSLALFFF